MGRHEKVKKDSMLLNYETSVEKNNLDKIAESIFNLKSQNKFLKSCKAYERS